MSDQPLKNAAAIFIQLSWLGLVDLARDILVRLTIMICLDKGCVRNLKMVVQSLHSFMGNMIMGVHSL